MELSFNTLSSKGKWHRWTALLALGVVGLLLGMLQSCFQEPRLEGRVESLLGGAPDALLDIVGIDGKHPLGADGQFSIPYPPGRFTLRVEAPGFVTLTQEWWLTDGRTVKLSPIQLVPHPPGDGLWKPTPGAYLGLPQQTLRQEAADTLGLSSLKRQRFVFALPQSVVCLERQLILQGHGFKDEPLLFYPVSLQGELEHGGVEHLPDPIPRLLQLGVGIWQLSFSQPGRLALIPQRQEGADVLPAGWFLEVRQCGGST
jgi:hypothetical protein